MKKQLLGIAVTFFLSILSISASFGQGQACVGSQTITATPPPSGNGTYFSGTTVTFCYTVNNYAQAGADWLCGIVPTLGPGWDASTLTPISPSTSCDGQGTWGWYTSCTSTASGFSYGPGFFYDSPLGSPGGVADGIPGNNFGDNCQTYSWVFCFSVQVAPCITAPNGTDLTMSINAYGDYAAGSWGTNACLDPPAVQPATVFCNCTLIVPTVAITNATCSNSSDGSITVTAQGVAPYTYLWNTGATTATINNLAPGIYTITVTDSTLCDKVVTIPVDGPDEILSNATIIPNGCSAAGGSIALNPSGGNGGPFTYLWNTGATTSGITNLPGGQYIVTISDTLSCTEIDTFNISTVVPITLATSSTPETCIGSNGSASVSASGGLLPYVFLWSNGSVAASAINLTAGTYTITVSDAQGCTSQATVVVSSVPGIVASAGTDTSSCSGQSVTLNSSVTGGAGPYTYSWDNGSSGATISVSPTVTTTYTVLVTDITGCTSTDMVTVNVTAYPVITLSPDATICFGSGTQLSASGGSTWSWTPATGLSSTTIDNPYANPTATTTYTVTASNGACSSTANVTITVEPEILGAFTPSPSQGPIPLSVVFANGTSGATSYSWNFGDGNTSTDQSPTHIYTLQGNYTVMMVAYNASGCTDTVTYSFIVVDATASLFVPNVFTPNGDNSNDTFHFVEKGIASIEVKILNRWGNEVYSWTSLNAGWDGNSTDGKELPDGVYLYIIKARGDDGKSYDTQGTVQLIRSGK